MASCPFCDHQNPEGATSCAGCGKPLETSPGADEAASAGKTTMGLGAPDGPPPLPAASGPRATNPRGTATPARRAAPPPLPRDVRPPAAKPGARAAARPEAAREASSGPSVAPTAGEPSTDPGTAPAPARPTAKPSPAPSRVARLAAASKPAPVPVPPVDSAALPTLPPEFLSVDETTGEVRTRADALKVQETVAASVAAARAQDEAPPPGPSALEALVDRGSSSARKAVAAVSDGVQTSRAFATSLLDAARHVMVVLQDNRRRRQVIADLHEDLTEHQTRLQQTVRELGLQAREAHVEHEELAEELTAIRAAEEKIEAAEEAREELAERRQETDREYQGLDAEQRASLSEREEALVLLSGELSSKVAERAKHREELGQIEAQLKTLSHDIGEKEAQILKEHESSLQATLRRDVEHLRTEVAGLEPDRDELVGQIAELDTEVGDLEARVEEVRAQAEELRQGLSQFARERRLRQAEVEADAERRSAEIGLYEREIHKRCLTLGELVSRHRGDLPEFADLYQQIDDLSAQVTRRLVEIGSLREEIHASMQEPFRKGVIVLASAATLGLLILILLIRLIF